MNDMIQLEAISAMIHWIQGEKVILDRDLALLYGVGTRALKQAVKRNPERFPEDFMFELNDSEFADWRSQFVISKSDRHRGEHRVHADLRAIAAAHGFQP